MVWLSVRLGPRSEPGVGSQPNEPAMPRSRNPALSWVSRPRPLTSARIPVAGSDHASPPPRSRPNPVSASPPSWRTPISRRGLSVPVPISRPRHVPSSPSRRRVTSAVAAARLPPALPPVASEEVRTPIASVFTASSGPPSGGASTTTPRSPAAAIMRSMSVSSAPPSPGSASGAGSGVSVSVPTP